VDSQALENKPRWERRKDARPAELMAAALDLFVDKGYAGTRLDDVAARAGVSKGTLYLYFANKEELFKAVVRENIVRNIDQAAAAVAAHQGPSDRLLHDLVQAWWATMGLSKASGISKLMLAESGNFPEIATFYHDEVIHPAHRVMERAIERGIARGEFRPVDVETFTRVLVAPIVMLMLWQHSFGLCCNEPIDPQRYLATHIDAFNAALRAAPAPAAASGRRLAPAATERRTGGAKRGRPAKGR
jgi:AcrR family transcriptional regulator